MVNKLLKQISGRGISPARFWSDLFILVGALALLWNSMSIRDFGFDVLGPAFMPQFVLWILIGLTVLDIAVLLFSAHATPGSAEDVDQDNPEFQVAILRPRSLAALGALAAYIAVLSTGKVSFELASVFFVTLTGYIAGARTKRSIVLLVVVSVIYAVAAGMLFRNIFFVALP